MALNTAGFDLHYRRAIAEQRKLVEMVNKGTDANTKVDKTHEVLGYLLAAIGALVAENRAD